MAKIDFSPTKNKCNLLFALLLLLATPAIGQDDFPPIGNIPPWGPPPQPGFPPPPGNDQWESGSVPGSYQTLWGVKRGDTIGFDAILDGWGLGALYLAPMCSNCTNMRYLPPIDGTASKEEQWWHGGLGTWCLRCGWEATAGDDNPTIWIDYTSQRDLWFAAHLEWKYTIPRASFSSWFSVLTNPDKQTAGTAATGLNMAGDFWTVAALFLAPYDWKGGALLGVMGVISYRFAAYYDRIRSDPWDWNYCEPVYWEIDQATLDEFSWVWAYDTANQGWLPYSAIIVISAGIKAQTAIDRALTAAQIADWDQSAEGCAWARRDEARAFIRMMGDYMHVFRWAIQADGNSYLNSGWDWDTVWHHWHRPAEDLVWIAQWSQSLN